MGAALCGLCGGRIRAMGVALLQQAMIAYRWGYCCDCGGIVVGVLWWIMLVVLSYAHHESSSRRRKTIMPYTNKEMDCMLLP